MLLDPGTGRTGRQPSQVATMAEKLPNFAKGQVPVTALDGYKRSLTSVSKISWRAQRNLDCSAVKFFPRSSVRDHGDWQLNPELFDLIKQRWRQTGYKPWTLDACSDRFGFNSFCKKYCSKDRPFQTYDPAAGRSIWCNPDFNKITQTVARFKTLQSRNPNTVMCLITPFTPDRKWFPIVQ